MNWSEVVQIPVIDSKVDGPTLSITRGIQGCGKTTWATAVVSANHSGDPVRVNRDELRRMMLRSGYSKPNPPEEQAVTLAQRAAVEALLRGGRSVIVDDMNLRSRYVREWLLLARATGAGATIVDFTQVPLDVCIARDAQRTAGMVGKQIILDTHARYIAGQSLPLRVPGLPPADSYTEVVAYVAPVGRQAAFLVDLDGTVALMNGRDPYDESCVIDDLPNTPVIQVVQALIADGLQPVFMSGRTAVCREDTEAWLLQHVYGMKLGATSLPAPLLMRTPGDQRRDAVVKLELFDNYVRRNYDVRLVLDDRQQVVDMWRSLGLVCMQVAEGDF